MNRHARRDAWRLAKSEFRGVGHRTHWRDMWRQAWASYKVGPEGHGTRVASWWPVSGRAIRARRAAARAKRANPFTGEVLA